MNAPYETIKLRIMVVALGFLGFGLAMFAWAVILILGVSMEQTRIHLLSAAPLYLVLPGIVVLGAAALATGIALFWRATWSRPMATLLCLSALLFFPVGSVFGLFGLWALSTSLSEEARS